jgi:hypothetical protein
MTPLPRIVVTAAFAACGLTACVAPHTPAQPISATKPTVTYAYRDDQGLTEATAKAETYCRQYNAWPRVTDIFTPAGGGRNAVFVCDQPRPAMTAAAPIGAPAVVATSPGVVVAPPAVPTVNYTYRDDRSLIDVSNQAQAYCLNYSANAHSTLISNNVDGSRTITFQCTRP